MITWDNFHWFAMVAALLWIVGAGAALVSGKRSRWAIILSVAGTLVFGTFIVGFWISLQRPPLRTMGETRLWYSFYGSIGVADLSPMEVPLDFGFFCGGGDCVCFAQHPQTGNS